MREASNACGSALREVSTREVSNARGSVPRGVSTRETSNRTLEHVHGPCIVLETRCRTVEEV